MKDKQLSLEVNKIYRCTGYNDFFIKIIEIDHNKGWIYGLNAYNPSYYSMSMMESDTKIPCGRWDIEYFNRTFVSAIQPSKIWKDLNT